MSDIGSSAAPENKFEKEVRRGLTEIKDNIKKQAEEKKESPAQVG